MFLAILLALVACGNNNHNGSSRGHISRSTSRDPDQTSVISEDSSESSPKESSSDVPSSDQSDSKEEPSSEPASSESASSSSASDEPFAYDSYLLKHEEGKEVEYVFEAECTNLGGKEGPGYSGATSESGMAVYDSESGRACVTYLYSNGCSLNFFIVSDRDVDNAVMSLNLAGEFIFVDLNPDKYQIRVDYPDAKYLESAETSEDGCLGYWDALYLSTFTDPSVNGGYYVKPWECGNIEIDAYQVSTITGWKEFKITSSLKLKRGITCISLITANSEAVGMGTMAANAAVVDNMIIKTTAQLGMFDEQDNSQGDNGCHFRA